MALASPFFREFELARRIELVVPELSFGSPLDGGRAALAYHSLERTVAGTRAGRRGLPQAHGPARQPHRRRHGPDPAPAAADPGRPLAAGAVRPAGPGAGVTAVECAVQGGPGAGTAERRGRACGFAVALAGRRGRRADAGALAHAQGWPVPRAARRPSPRRWPPTSGPRRGGRTGRRITAWRSCRRPGQRCWTWRPPDCSPGRDRLPPRYRSSLASFRYGNGSCKVDYILSGPVPWAAESWPTPGPCTWAAHGPRWPGGEPGGRRKHPERPYVLVAQPSRFDAGRAPAGRHILWAYCHVPAGSTGT